MREKCIERDQITLMEQKNPEREYVAIPASVDSISGTESQVSISHISTTMSRREKLVVPVVLLAVMIVPMSISGTAVALNNIYQSLGGSAAELQWVVNAFNLAFACCTLVWGSLADRYGYRKLFVVGAVLFAAGAIISGFAQNIIILDGARAIAGIGGSAIFSCGGAMLSHLPDAVVRARAFAYFGSIAGIGLALGPTISGFFIEWWNFRPLFIIQGCILGLVVILSQFMRVSQKNKSSLSQENKIIVQRFDLLGIVTLIIGLFSFMMFLMQGQIWGWFSVKEISLVIFSLIVLLIFVRIELHKSNPLVELRFLKNSHFVGLILVPVAQACGFVTFLTYYPTFLMIGAHFSSLSAGYLIISLTIPVILGPMLAAYLVNKRYCSTMTIIYISLAALIIGDAILILVSQTHPLIALVIPALCITGIGMGFSTGLVDGAAIAQVPPAHAGMAAGIMNTSRLSGEALGVALYAVLLEAFLQQSNSSSAYVIAFRHTGEIILLSVIVLSLIIIRFFAKSHSTKIMAEVR